jgi:WD40 repeat protein
MASDAAPPTDLDSLLVAAREEQANRWRAGDPVRVETLLTRYPDLSGNPENVLVLVVGEVELRRERGETPTPDEYRERFPTLSGRLTIQFPLLDALATPGLSTIPEGRDTASVDREHLPAIPGYRVTRVLGRGGMGVVYEAHDERLNRPAAVKMVLAGRYGSAAVRARFQVEAEAVASLRHPNVVGVYEYGECDGQPFFALEYVGGGTLADRLERDGRLAPRVAAEILATLAGALAAAHARGIVHRDLKPANVLLTEAGEPKVTDFGIAKVGDSGATATGAVMGTPSYMSPEQAAGRTREVGTPADIYSLGAILYELLTGRPPFAGESAMVVMHRVINETPARLRSLAPDVPADLETICLKCLSKEIPGRYPTADALAADLRNWLDGRPISARPAGKGERAWKWVRRNPAVAGAVAAAVLGLTVGSGFAIGFGIHAGDQAEEARRQKKDADDATEREKGETARANREKEAAIIARNDEGRAKRLAQAQTARAEGLLVEGMLAKTRDAIQRDNIRLAKDLLNDTPWHLRGWEYRHLWTRVSAPQTFRTESMPSSLCFTGDSSSLAASYRAGKNSVVRLWAVETGAMTVLPTAPGEWSLDLEVGGKGELVGVRTDLVVQRWNLTTGQRTATSAGKPLYKNAFPEDSHVCFSPDRKWLAYATDISDFTGTYPIQSVKLWDVEKDTFVRELSKHTKGISKLRYSPKGTHIASTSTDKTVKLWDLEAQAESTLDLGAEGCQNLWFTPDGTGLLAKTYTGVRSELKLWDVAQKKVTRTILLDKVDLHELDISPDARWYATGEHDGRVRVWEFATGRLLRTYHGHTSAAFLVRFSPDGKKLASADYSGLIQVWDAERDATPPTLSTGKQPIHCAAFAPPDGKTFATGGAGTTFTIWDADTLTAITTVNTQIPSDRFIGQVWDIKYSPDGKYIATCGQEVKLWDAKTGAFVRAFTGHRKVVFHLAFSADGKRLYAAPTGHGPGAERDPGDVWEWEVETGEKLAQFAVAEKRGKDEAGQTDCLAFSPDGHLITGVLAAAGSGGVIKFWNLADRTVVRGLTGHHGRVNAVVFNKAGTRMAACGYDEITLWDTKTWERLRQARVRGGSPNSLLYSKDGTRLFFGCSDGSVRVWDADALQEMLSLPGHGQGTLAPGGDVRGLALSPDGTRLVSGGKDGTIRVWQALRSSEYADLKGHRQPVTRIAFAVDGSRVFAWDKAGELLAWSLRDGSPAETDGAPSGGIEGAVTSPDGRFLAEPFGSPANGNVAVRMRFLDSR